MLRFPGSCFVLLLAAVASAQPPGMIKKSNRANTIAATLAAHGLPNLAGKWMYAGPFPFQGEGAFDKELPPDKDVKFDATYPGRDGATISWKPYPNFETGKVLDLKPLFPAKHETNSAVFLALEFPSDKAYAWPLSFGSDDTLTVHFNGKRLIHDNTNRAAAADQAIVEAAVRVGKNLLVVKIGQYAFNWEAYVAPGVPSVLPEAVRKQIDREFPQESNAKSNKDASSKEAKHYAVDTFTPPENAIL